MINAWDWEPSVVIGCALAGHQLSGIHARAAAKVWYFLAGVLVLLLDLVSPSTCSEINTCSVRILSSILCSRWWFRRC